MRLPRLTSHQQALAARYEPLARSLAAEWSHSYPRHDPEAFTSAALYALTLGARKFDASKNVKFATYVRIRITGELKRETGRTIARGFEADPRSAPYFTSLYHFDGIGLEGEGFDPDPTVEALGRVPGRLSDPAPGQDLEADDAFEALLDRFPPECRELLSLLFRDDLSVGAAADSLGLTRHEALELYRAALDAAGVGSLAMSA